MNIQQYLKRIGYQKSINVSKKVLFDLQNAHLQTVPFENLDIHYNKHIVLDYDSFFNKIVVNNRGGFCYELNGLFFQLLKNIGFNAKIVSGRVYSKDETYGDEFDHLAIIVALKQQQFLVDVGFGKFSFNPLEIKKDSKILDNFGIFQFDTYGTDYLRINEIKNNEVVPQYIFRTNACNLKEFEKMCNYHQQSNESHFTKQKIISITTANGRITLNNNKVKITNGGAEHEIIFEEDDFEYHLQKYFDINLSLA